MRKLPKAIIQKYGISKKAWAVFRSRKRTAKTVRPPTRPKKVRRITMARKRSFKRYARSAMKPTSTILGAVAYSLLEPTINQFAGRLGMGMSDDIVKAVGGYILAKRRGIIGGVGMAALTISAYKLAKTQNLLGGVASGAVVTTNGTGATF